MDKGIIMMPAVALRATCVLPGMIIHFDISRKISMKAVEQAMLSDQKIFLITQLDPQVEEPGDEDVFSVGTTGTIRQLVKLPDGLVRVLVEGEKKAGFLGFEKTDGYLTAKVVDLVDEDHVSFIQEQGMTATLKELFMDYALTSGRLNQDLVHQILELKDIDQLISQMAIQLPLSWEEAQDYLNKTNLSDRFEYLAHYLSNEAEIMRIKVELQEKIKEQLDENQKEYVLREQIKIIREELGDDEGESQIEEYRRKCEELIAPDNVKEKIREEISRLSSIGINNPSEGGVIRGYLDTLLGLPWDKMSEDNTDLSRAREILEEDHYGLKTIKERILEFLAVRILNHKGDAPVLCLVGPPGTGKTSIGRSVARALDRQYIRISLGGVRDEAEIRGHRRTYIGAMPGRIAQGLHQAGVKNPLMVLDEIDKSSADYRGDTASALLEVLDTEQNCRFSDHYVELPIDLSEVLFIATANDPSEIPQPLLDRMEVIEVSGYTENEKLHIAKEHLIPKQLKANGILKKSLSISDKALSGIISGYTKEAGVRQLERLIGRICRKSALKINEEGLTKISVTGRNLEDFLGRKKYTVNKANPKPEIGIVRGLAWTTVGGETLEVEVNIMPGKGELKITGQIGDVMKESAQAGISYLRSVAEKYDIDSEFFLENDIHIHIPEGAVPKDGPSAGITMATAMFSAITKRPAASDIAMTGEITLRGRVLPIGGLKEKLLAARMAGMKRVLVPEENRPSVEELDSEITEGLKIIYVRDMEQVLKEAIC